MSTPRRTFAIISHPDAGKTTLTEKLLLYSGAIGEAGAVEGSSWKTARRHIGLDGDGALAWDLHHLNRAPIRIRDHVFNLLDTPGHRDFSEDTYRVLSAVDAAIIVLDAAKGIEAQTKKLFEVAKAKKTPIITFINKCDRPGVSPLSLLDEIEDELGIVATPLTWPVGLGPQFEGVVDRRDGAFWKFGRSDHGAKTVAEERLESADLQDTARWRNRGQRARVA